MIPESVLLSLGKSAQFVGLVASQDMVECYSIQSLRLSTVGLLVLIPVKEKWADLALLALLSSFELYIP
jgi:hypothetical protein